MTTRDRNILFIGSAIGIVQGVIMAHFESMWLALLIDGAIYAVALVVLNKIAKTTDILDAGD